MSAYTNPTHVTAFFTNAAKQRAIDNLGEVGAFKLDKARMIMNCLELSPKDIDELYAVYYVPQITETLAGKKPMTHVNKLSEAVKRLARGRTDELREALQYRVDVFMSLINDLDEGAI